MGRARWPTTRRPTVWYSRSGPCPRLTCLLVRRHEEIEGRELARAPQEVVALVHKVSLGKAEHGACKSVPKGSALGGIAGGVLRMLAATVSPSSSRRGVRCEQAFANVRVPMLGEGCTPSIASQRLCRTPGIPLHARRRGHPSHAIRGELSGRKFPPPSQGFGARTVADGQGTVAVAGGDTAHPPS